MSFRTDDERALLLEYEEYRRGYDDPSSIHPAELVGAFMAEREQRQQQWSNQNERSFED